MVHQLSFSRRGNFVTAPLRDRIPRKLPTSPSSGTHLSLSAWLDANTCAALSSARQYHYFVARNQNPFRWNEYTFSCFLDESHGGPSLQALQISPLLAVNFLLSAITMQLGAAHEVFNAKARSEDREQNWRCYYLAWVSQGVSWMIIFNYFAMRVRSGSQPDFIWAIMIVMFLLDSSFALVFYLQWAKVPPFHGESVGWGHVMPCLERLMLMPHAFCVA